ncbi:zinc finger protein 135-like isoform X2 [Hetaerina americana]|uniref:zinc finger protein 135-like isoform X2 n=1 Tax=Hetaerina americana TaxID=62018 RepID=UPI003A7F5ECD
MHFKTSTMFHKRKGELCRLCLSSCVTLINIFEEKEKFDIMLESTIEDLINIKVVRENDFPWLVCCTCVEKLNDFRIFKRQCTECLFVFRHRIQRGHYPEGRGDLLISWAGSEDEDDGSVDTHDSGKEADDIKGGIGVVADDFEDGISTKVEDDTGSVTGTAVASKAGSRMEAVVVSELRPMASKDIPATTDTFMGQIISPNVLDGAATQCTIKEEVEGSDSCGLEEDEEERGIDNGTVAGGSGCNSAVKEDLANGGRLTPTAQVHPSLPEDTMTNPLTSTSVRRMATPVLPSVDSSVPRDGVDSNGTLTCQVCEEVFSCWKEYSAHRETHSTMGYICNFCKEEFTQMSHLKGHIEVVHLSLQKFPCDICHKTFGFKSSLDRHMDTHKTFNPVVCRYCSSTFSRNSSLVRHIQSLHEDGRKHVCAACSKSFSQKSQLKQHMSVHSEEKPFECDVCLKRFGRSSYLKNHMRTHSKAEIDVPSEDRPYNCLECKMSFTTMGYFNRHMSAHTRAKQLKCSFCQKKFSHKGNLNSHLLIHTNEKSHACPLCSRSFRLKGALTKHLAIHERKRRLEGQSISVSSGEPWAKQAPESTK